MDINLQDLFGDTALHIAASKGYLRLISMLVEKYKAQINVSNINGQTPSLYASIRLQDDAFKYLQSKVPKKGFVKRVETLAYLRICAQSTALTRRMA